MFCLIVDANAQIINCILYLFPCDLTPTLLKSWIIGPWFYVYGINSDFLKNHSGSITSHWQCKKVALVGAESCMLLDNTKSCLKLTYLVPETKWGDRVVWYDAKFILVRLWSPKILALAVTGADHLFSFSVLNFTESDKFSSWQSKSIGFSFFGELCLKLLNYVLN